MNQSMKRKTQFKEGDQVKIIIDRAEPSFVGKEGVVVMSGFGTVIDKEFVSVRVKGRKRPAHGYQPEDLERLS